ncbi:MAG TPA: methyl-accepting chemotaxis protein, partial [Thiotrichales bacterium]|nr:methyl-accepting chemotaxis protein [Thiotrichales bacterium]
LFLMLLLAVFAIYKMGQLDAADTQLYEQELLGLNHIKELNIALLGGERVLRNAILLQKDARLAAESNKYFDEFLVFQKHARDALENASPKFHLAESKKLIDQLRIDLATYDAAQLKVIELAKAELNQNVPVEQRNSVYMLTVENRQYADKVTSAVNRLVELKQSTAKATSDANTELYHSSRNMMILLLLVAIAIGLFLGLLIASRMSLAAKMLQQALGRVAEQTNQTISQVNGIVAALAQGDFSRRMSYDAVSLMKTDVDRDEMGQAVESLYGMVSRLNASFDSMQKNLNDSMNVAQSAISEMDASMRALANGNFSAQVNVQAPGEFGNMLRNVADSMKVLSLVVSDINQIMQRLNDGNFDARVNANAQGDLLQMKQAVNSTLDTLEELVNDLVHVAKAQMEGDLTVVSQGTYKGRFKELQDARAASTARITEVVTLALQASHVVSDAASQVSQGSSDLSSRVQEQAAALEQTSATMHQMTSAVQANTENASKVAELAHQVQGQSNDGVQVMQQTIEAMKSIQQASNKIADIVSIIDSIAFQTNLLALNAAVEAARAGEHGRGFAVVASEVRALAGKSADAAKDIKGLIEDSVQRIDAGTKLADKSGEMLSTISESVKEVANMIEAISSASKEQTTGISQVHLAIADIDRVTQENAALVEETTAAAESLNHEANELRQNMSFFKTGQSNHATARPVVKATANSSATKGLPSPKANSSSGEWSEF